MPRCSRETAWQVFGYERLYRGQASDTACAAGSDVATATVLTGAALDLGLEALTGGRPAFLNVTREVLLGEIHTLLPSQGVVLGLQETIEVNNEVVAACRDLQARGYRLALDDFGTSARSAGCGRWRARRRRHERATGP